MRERRGSKIFLTLKSEMIGCIIILNEIAGYIFKQMYLFNIFVIFVCMCTGSFLNLGQSSISGTSAPLRKLSYFRNLVPFQDETELRQNIVLFQKNCLILGSLVHLKKIAKFQEYCPISGIFSHIRNLSYFWSLLSSLELCPIL